MFSKNNKIENSESKNVYDHSDALSVRCKIIEGTKTGVNYLINIEGYTGGITVLLDQNGNPKFSQVKL